MAQSENGGSVHPGDPHSTRSLCSLAQGRLSARWRKTRAFGMTQALGRVRRSSKLQVYAYVVMPERVQLLLSELQEDASRNAPLKPKDGLNGPPAETGLEWASRLRR
ncbi:MAG: hypothetical protein WAN76_20315 [Candidatus Sulfotelmatobacter sp.]